MGLFHLIGLLIGGLVLFISRFFWISVCYVTSESYDILDKEICLAFENFFTWIGILIIVLSVLGFIKKIFFKS
jgi:hypothetical protein